MAQKHLHESYSGKNNFKSCFVVTENVLKSTCISLQYRNTSLFVNLVHTGYPVLRQKVEFKKGSRCANKPDWNKFVMATKVECIMSEHHTVHC